MAGGQASGGASNSSRRPKKKGGGVAGAVAGGVGGLVLMYVVLVLAGVPMPGFPGKNAASTDSKGQPVRVERKDGRPSGVRPDLPSGSLDDLQDKFKGIAPPEPPKK